MHSKQIRQNLRTPHAHVHPHAHIDSHAHSHQHPHALTHARKGTPTHAALGSWCFLTPTQIWSKTSPTPIFQFQSSGKNSEQKFRNEFSRQNKSFRCQTTNSEELEIELQMSLSLSLARSRPLSHSLTSSLSQTDFNQRPIFFRLIEARVNKISLVDVSVQRQQKNHKFYFINYPNVWIN